MEPVERRLPVYLPPGRPESMVGEGVEPSRHRVDASLTHLFRTASPSSPPTVGKAFAVKVDALLRRTTVSAISFYQRRLSPLKGFRCAHRVLHGGDSCSQHAKDLVARLGPRAAVEPTRTRLVACRDANEALRAGAFWPNTRRGRRRRERSRWRRWFRRRPDDADDAFDDSPDGDASGCGPESLDCDFCDCGP